MCASKESNLQEASLDLQLRQLGVLPRLRCSRRQRLEARQQVRSRCKDGLRHQKQLRARLLKRLNHLPKV